MDLPGAGGGRADWADELDVAQWMDATEIEMAVEAWQADKMEALVWDGASSHRGELILEANLPQMMLSPGFAGVQPGGASL